MVSRLKQSEGDIFLSIGSKHVQQFEDVKSRIVARVLPVEESIHQCRAAGLQPHQIIAMKGLSSVETHRALFAEYQVVHLVSKDSGRSGGLPEKVEAAKALGLQIHLLQRPQLHYPLVFTEIEKLIEYLQ